MNTNYYLLHGMITVFAIMPDGKVKGLFNGYWRKMDGLDFRYIKNMAVARITNIKMK
jgi:hypothetical protein